MQDMLGDLFTKPLQGALYARMREKILNLSGSTNTTVHRSLSEHWNISTAVNENKITDGPLKQVGDDYAEQLKEQNPCGTWVVLRDIIKMTK